MLDDVEAAVRAWAVPDDLRLRAAAHVDYEDPGPSALELTVDTETLPLAGQGLRVITHLVHLRGRLIEAGLSYHPDAVTQTERAVMETYARDHKLVLRTYEQFITEVFIRVIGRGRGLLVLHNAGFDLSRLASDHGAVGAGRDGAGRIDRTMLGGVSFAFPGTSLRLQVKRTTARSAFIRLALPEGFSPEKRNRLRGGRAADHRGYIVDTGTVGGALLGRKLTLKRLAELLGTEHRKTEADLAGPITPELLDYAMNDVVVTRECYVALRDRYAAFGLHRPLWRIHSEASIAKAHLDVMGLSPWRRIQPDFPAAFLSAILETYYGGRVGCGVRAQPLPGWLVDYSSEYPTVSTLMGMWAFQVASGVDVADEDPAVVQTWLEAVTVDAVLEKAFWPQLNAIVLLDPLDARLPTRAPFTRPSRHRPGKAGSPNRNVALVDRVDRTAQWWTLADAVAAVLESGRAPRVLRVLRFKPQGVQPDLAPIDVAGDPRYRVDPTEDDFVRRLVELRTELRGDATKARSRGDERLADELDARARATKQAGNSIAYGCPIEIDTTDYAQPIGVTLHLPDGSSIRPGGVRRREEPGKWFHPLVATLVVAGGRLLLAAAMRLVHDAGGTYVFTDTDSLFIVATRVGGWVPARGLAAQAGSAPVWALPWSAVRAIAERFVALNPYDPDLMPGSILNLKRVNWDSDTGEEREVWCLALAAKRYALFTLDAEGRPHIAIGDGEKYRSEHGLGHLLSPYGRQAADDARDWIDEWWLYLIDLELGRDVPAPSWFEEPAVGALSITSAQEERAFRTYNDGRPYQERVRPWGFLMTAHVPTLARTSPGPRVLVAPREDDPDQRRLADWVDRGDTSGTRIGIRTGDPGYLVPGLVAVQSYGDYFDEFRRHPEAKAAGPDGSQCRPWTRGQLGPLTVAVTSLVRIGKEAGPLVSDVASADAEAYRAAEYRSHVCAGCGKPIAANRRWCSETCRKRTERRLDATLRTCARCGDVLARSQRRWCSDACRKRAHRLSAKSRPAPGANGQLR